MGLFTWKKETEDNPETVGLQKEIDSINLNLDAHHTRLNIQRIDLNTIRDITFNQISDLTNRIQLLENQMLQQDYEISRQQSIQDVKPKYKRILNSYADSKFNKAFEIASGYYASGLNQTEIAYKLNQLKYRSARGQSFDSKAVSKLLTNKAQKQRFMQPKVRNGKQP